MVVRRQSALRGLDVAQRRRSRARGTRCSATRTRSPTSSSPARPRTRCSRRNGPKSPSCSWRWVCASRCSSDWPAEKPVNGQHPYTAHVVELPMRAADGSLHFTPALLPRTADVAADYLPLTRANLLRQSFKFLGERYGWGHSYNARDCSGFVSEVYRSFGVQLPRNTRDQGVSPALESHRVHGRRRSREEACGAARAASRGPDLHSRPRDDGDRPRQRRAVRHPRHDGHQPIAMPTAWSPACT